ncbi:E3 ubiquitin-protein ligase HUWE1 [Hypsibius exemplaris]|uniref:E3 ubiquitin-protein ligase HUWE1 n=1 Tax=Hypsibius exemplaris TaxID=2072580 RepID=A0A1W0WDZ5_HYPEX|nr:E3 ubiquitin-protein ligase HUWE1 [Hypsibius exemplaris]
MKIDRSKVKKVPGDAPADTKVLIQQITSALPDEALLATCLAELSPPKSWEVAKCELFHWSEILNKFDDILAKATETTEWTLACDRPGAEATKDLVMKILVFTGQLIEHSFSRHLYNSMDRLIALLDSDDMLLVQNVLTLLYTFSKRSSFLTRLREEITKGLFLRLQLLAETWGGKVNGFGLAKCCEDISLEQFPTTSTTVHFEFFSEQEVEDENGLKRSVTNIIHVENVDKMKPKTIPQIMNDLVREYSIPESKQIPLYFHLRLAYSFADYKARVFCVHSRLLSLAILAYTNHIPENLTSYIYSGIVEELVDVLQLKSHDLLELKAAVMRTLTAVVHHDRGSRCMDIIDATSSSSYHGFLPVLVRTCIQSLTESRLDDFPVAYATAVFSFLYHMASYESGGDALVACGMMESMLKVVNWYDTTEENITFVTRAVRVIDLITNIDMASFQNHNGLSIFTRRLEHEVEICRKAQPYVIRVQAMDSSQAGTANETDTAGGGEYESGSPPSLERTESGEKDEDKLLCFPQRAALLKSILNFLKKIIPDATFTDSIRHLMDGTLPSSLKHIISNADYYGHSLFLLATDIVTVYVFHEPAMLTSLQDRGLTDVILQAVLVKDLNANREVLSAIPNICSALCLNARGLQAFVACKPFEKLFKVLLSPGYLVAMRRRRNGEGHGDMAAGLGAAVDELMRHQPSLRTQAMQDIVKLLNQLCEIGRDSSNVCAMSGPVQQGISRQLRPDQSIPGESSDDEDEFEDSQQGGGISFPSVPSGLLLAGPSSTSASDIKEKLTVPLMDYIINVTKFVEAVLTSNSTDDHCREFIRQDGLKPLMEIFRLPNLPLEFPMMPACQAANALVKSVVAYCRDQPVLDEAFRHMDVVLKEIKEISKARLESGGSAILNEWAQCPPNIEDAIREPTNTPLLHRLSYMHSYIGMMTCICKLNQSDIKTLYTNAWATEIGIRLLHEIADLYGFLLWETTILQQLGSEDGLAANECDAARADLKVVLANRKGVTEEDATSLLPLSLSSSNLDAATPMDVDGDQPAAAAVTAGLATPKRMSVQEKIRLHSQLLTKFLRPATAMGMKLCRITTELLSLMVGTGLKVTFET